MIADKNKGLSVSQGSKAGRQGNLRCFIHNAVIKGAA